MRPTACNARFCTVLDPRCTARLLPRLWASPTPRLRSRSTRPSRKASDMKVIGYLRCSTREQAESGLGLDAQRRTISDEAGRRGWEVVWLVDDGRSARNLNRPALRQALALLKQGEASALVVAKLDRLSRSVSD